MNRRELLQAMSGIPFLGAISIDEFVAHEPLAASPEDAQKIIDAPDGAVIAIDGQAVFIGTFRGVPIYGYPTFG